MRKKTHTPIMIKNFHFGGGRVRGGVDVACFSPVSTAKLTRRNESREITRVVERPKLAALRIPSASKTDFVHPVMSSKRFHLRSTIITRPFPAAEDSDNSTFRLRKPVVCFKASPKKSSQSLSSRSVQVSGTLARRNKLAREYLDGPASCDGPPSSTSSAFDISSPPTTPAWD